MIGQSRRRVYRIVYRRLSSVEMSQVGLCDECTEVFSVRRHTEKNAYMKEEGTTKTFESHYGRLSFLLLALFSMKC